MSPISASQSAKPGRNPVPPMFADARDLRDYVGHGVNARRDLGRERAIEQVARELDFKPRRVLAILKGEVRRFWLDEAQAIAVWYAAECARQAAKLEHEAALYRARADALTRRIEGA